MGKLTRALQSTEEDLAADTKFRFFRDGSDGGAADGQTAGATRRYP